MKSQTLEERVVALERQVAELQASQAGERIVGNARPVNGSNEKHLHNAPNAAVLHALDKIEEAWQGMNPKMDKHDYLREARSGAMYGFGDDD